MRLVDADALLANRQIIRGQDVIGIRDYVTVAEIENAPTIEPERETGEWIRHPEQKNIFGGKTIECSECGEKYVVQYIEDEKFCRNCGADMRKEGDKDDRT